MTTSSHSPKPPPLTFHIHSLSSFIITTTILLIFTISSLSLPSPPLSPPSFSLFLHGPESLSQLACSSHGWSLVSPSHSFLELHVTTLPHYPQNCTTNYLIRFSFVLLIRPFCTTSFRRRNLSSLVRKPSSTGNKKPLLSPNLNLTLLLNDVSFLYHS